MALCDAPGKEETLWVGNVGVGMSDAALSRVCGQFAEVTRARMLRKPTPGGD